MKQCHGYCDLNDTEYEIAVMKKLSELRENSERQLRVQNNINDQKECLLKRSKLVKNQAEIELKNSINKTTKLESIGNREDHIKDRISEPKYRNLEKTQVD